MHSELRQTARTDEGLGKSDRQHVSQDMVIYNIVHKYVYFYVLALKV